jgi:hypothetical protein
MTKGLVRTTYFNYEIVLLAVLSPMRTVRSIQTYSGQQTTRCKVYGIVTQYDPHTCPSLAIWGPLSLYLLKQIVVKRCTRP